MIENVVGEPDEVVIKELTHKDGAAILGGGFGIDNTDFPDEMAINNEKITLTTHTGTHLDAPYHFGPICEGTVAKKVKDIPLEWCFGKGIVLDLSKQEGGISREEISTYIKQNNIKIEIGNIVMIFTGADKYWNSENYFNKFRGMSKEATLYLLEMGVKVIGIDSFGFDVPFEKMISEYLLTKDKNSLWPSHLLGRKWEYCHLERVANLKELLNYQNFVISCFPVKLDTGAAWTRAVALIEEDEDDDL